MFVLTFFACQTPATLEEPTWTSETPAADLSFAERELVCEEQLERTVDLEPTVCNGNDVDPAASLTQCTSIVFGLLEGCGLAVGDFEDCITEMLEDECALFRQPPGPGCAPLVDCLYVPE